VKTDELLNLLAADRITAPAPAQQLLRTLLPGVAVAITLYLIVAGWRADVIASLSSPRFIFKLAINAALILAAGALLLRLTRPEAITGKLRIPLLLILAALLIAVTTELLLLPQATWWQAAHGHNSTWCLRLIPTFAAAPLAATLYTLRRAAPTRPAMAGAVAGLVSAGIGGVLYATHCPDDSPLFVALWYGLATALVAAVGALAGARILRW
jgi:hypothetical protein